MTNSLLHKVKADFKAENIYKEYNLSENPFPNSPFINPNNSDKRYNGGIYEESVRETEIDTITNEFLKKAQIDPNHYRMGYILDKSYVGRGNGKSSYATYIINKINRFYCTDISNDLNKCFGVYVEPDTNGRTRSFVQLIDLIVKSIFDLNIIEYSIAAIRLEALLQSSIYKENDVLEKKEEELIENLNSNSFLNGLLKNYQDKIKSYNEYFCNHKWLTKLSPKFPLANNYGLFSLYPNKTDLYNYYLNIKKDTEKIFFLFNDLVLIFLAAGFNGAYIFVDDFERIPDFQSDRQKRDFALELRTCFFDGISENAKIGFYNIILMLHAGVPRLIEKAWSESGMEQRSPITTEGASHVIIFDKLNEKHAISLIKKYLSEFRIEPQNDIKPFDSEAIKKIGESCEYNAAKILQSAHNLLKAAAEQKIDFINKDFVSQQLQITSIELEAPKAIIDEQSLNLQDKADGK